MTGVEMVLLAFMISLMRGTPCVMFMLATPAKWNVLSVICVPGSPMLCAATPPTGEPAGATPHELHCNPAPSCSLAKHRHAVYSRRVTHGERA